MNSLDRINYVNIGLMLISMLLAFVLPFELFLFVYAVLGPLHYLTEISWLHDRNYFTKGRYDVIILIAMGAFITLSQYISPELAKRKLEHLELLLPGTQSYDTNYVWIALVGAAFMIKYKDSAFKFGSLLAITIISVIAVLKQEQIMYLLNDVWGEQLSSKLWLLLAGGLILILVDSKILQVIGLIFLLVASIFHKSFTLFLLAFVPTLIHVYVFTGFFILFGALKSKSRSGYLSMLLYLVIPAILVYVMPDARPLDISKYALETYPKFEGINVLSLQLFTDAQFTQENMFSQIYESNAGIVLMRFIAFAYCYHYLNWFSKTSIIRWHEVPKRRFAFVLILWVVSVALYAYRYEVGFEWLFLLSFLHVLLEFPLNHQSITGIAKEIGARFGLGSAKV
ncbi:MAG: hypothetical protein RL660_2549 [Bacteroidota bacterium]